jgi:nucleotide-binding universal stress UspA family protein
MLQEVDEGSRAEINRLGESLHKEEAEAQARKILGPLEKLAAKEGVKCTTTHVTSNTPYQAIIDGAQRLKCDLIIMASHGRSGLQAVLLGSETTKVLTHSKLPVLVVR